MKKVGYRENTILVITLESIYLLNTKINVPNVVGIKLTHLLKQFLWKFIIKMETI